MGMLLRWTLLWISGYCPRLSADVLVQYKYLLSGEGQEVSLQAPAEPSGTEFIWEWTSHDGRYTKARIITMQSSRKYSWNLSTVSMSKGRKYDISLRAKFENAGVFTFIQTKPVEVNLAQFEVFAAIVNPSTWYRVDEGSDVALSCEVSHLPDSATLGWERDREPTANTTLIYNKTALITIHSAHKYTEGMYNCTLRCNGELIFSIPKSLGVSAGTHSTSHILYRGSLDSSMVALICHSISQFNKASWLWEPQHETNAITLTSADKNENASISMEIDKERFLSEAFDGFYFPLRISPVKFGDSGRYFCHYDRHTMATVTLVTVQVSVEPPGGWSWNQSIELNCEISQVIDSVTMAWLWMKGGRGKLAKEEVLSVKNRKKKLSLTLPILRRDQLHWVCAVFRQSMLSAQAPLHLTLPTPTTEPTETKPDNGRRLVILLSCTAAVCTGALLLLGGLLFQRLKSATGHSTSPVKGCRAGDTVQGVQSADKQKDQEEGNADCSAADAVYSNVAELQNDGGTPDAPTEENDSEEIQYLVFSMTTPSADPHRQQQRQFNRHSEQEEKVVYASICTHNVENN